MQFNKDLNSVHAKLFLDCRALLLNQLGDDVNEKFSKNIISFLLNWEVFIVSKQPLMVFILAGFVE